MSLAWMSRVWSSACPAEAADRLLLLALADSANELGVCWPSVRTIARRCAVTRSAVFRTLARLEASGHIECLRTSGKRNTYRLVDGVLAAPTGRVDATRGVDTTGRVDATGGGGVDATGGVGATGRVDATGTGGVGATGTGGADATGGVGATGGVDATGGGSVDATGTGRVDATGPVAYTRPETTGTLIQTLTTTPRVRGRGAVALADLLPGGDGAAAAAGVNGNGMPPSADAVSVSASSSVSASPSSSPSGDGMSDEVAMAHAASLLTGRGVDAAAAQRLARQYGAARVREVVGAYDAGRGKGPGWLVAALERGFGIGGPATPVGATTVGGSGAGAPGGGGELLTHAAALAELSARGVVLDQLHPMTQYLDVVPQADGTVWFRLKASVPPAAFRRRL